MGLTLVEKIATRFAVGLPAGAAARSGEIITIRPRHVMTHDNTGAVIPKFKEMTKDSPRGTQIFDPKQPVFAIDHDIQNVTPENLGKYAKIEAFAREHGADFYPAGTGISHQVMVEQGYVIPGAMVVGSDSHSNLYGALAALGTPVVRTDAASLWATGMTWWQVPPVARCVLKGKLRPGVVGKDVIIALCGLFNKDEVLNHAVEFVGEGVASLTMDQRMSIANMTTEWGALAGVFPFDEILRDYLIGRADYFAAGRRPGVQRHVSKGIGTYSRVDVERWWANKMGEEVGRGDTGGTPGPLVGVDGARLSADGDAAYAVELVIDLSTIIPHVSGPNDVKKMRALPAIEAERVKINKAWLMSCVNARYEDLAAAAGIVRGKRVAEGVEFYLAAASADVQKKAEADGHWKSLVDAGAIELPPGCGTCIGLGRGTIKAGEVGISATNRNFDGRMGDRSGQVYLGSPAVVAASAIAGYICSPTKFEDGAARVEIRKSQSSHLKAQISNGNDAAKQAEVIAGFPASHRGRVLFLNKDNLNTDGIYAGKHTYNDAMTPEQMREVIFENYDPKIREMAAAGDVIVSGANFGTGSSREQAATALKFRGIHAVIAASFSETYKRNAFNNGFMVFECPALVEAMRDRGSEGSRDHVSEKTVDAGAIEVDYTRGVLRWDGSEFAFPALSPTAQALIVAGGAEAVVKQRLAGG